MRMDIPPTKEMMNVEEFLSLYSISRSAFYNEIKKKSLKIRKLGTRTYVLRKDAVLWLETLEEAIVP